jgi:demethylmenaquinone methyltransferase/2-methoxy-6-polyprenyl-1,4-benzoquinol methylase
MGLASRALRAPILRSAVAALQLPPGSRGLDAGCGIGLSTLPLAEAVGPSGRVFGLDLSRKLLSYAEEIATQAGLARQISFRVGDVRALPFDDAVFDWSLSVDCVGYAPLEPLPLVRELARVVKPGGTVAILAWSSETLLPSHPVLEARLGATSAGIAPFTRGKRPDLHFLRALSWLRDAGLELCTARTFAGEAYAPLTDDMRRGLMALFEMRWPGVEAELSPDERTQYRRLCLPDSPDFILNRPDYYAFYTYSMFDGRVPDPKR